MTKTINLTLKIWRQKNAAHKGILETYHAKDISTDMSFLEMLDVINEELAKKEKNRLLLITIAVRGYAGCAEQW